MSVFIKFEKIGFNPVFIENSSNSNLCMKTELKRVYEQIQSERSPKCKRPSSKSTSSAPTGRSSSSAFASSTQSCKSARNSAHSVGTSSMSSTTRTASSRCSTCKCSARTASFHGTRSHTSRARSRTAAALPTSGTNDVCALYLSASLGPRHSSATTSTRIRAFTLRPMSSR